jgi:hypothetical protein
LSKSAIALIFSGIQSFLSVKLLNRVFIRLAVPV